MWLRRIIDHADEEDEIQDPGEGKTGGGDIAADDDDVFGDGIDILQLGGFDDRNAKKDERGDDIEDEGGDFSVPFRSIEGGVVSCKEEIFEEERDLLGEEDTEHDIHAGNLVVIDQYDDGDGELQKLICDWIENLSEFGNLVEGSGNIAIDEIGIGAQHQHADREIDMSKRIVMDAEGDQIAAHEGDDEKHSQIRKNIGNQKDIFLSEETMTYVFEIFFVSSLFILHCCASIISVYYTNVFS